MTSRMNSRTVLAEGHKLKDGSRRRLTITMNEDEFLDFQALAIEEDRSLSSIIMRYAIVGFNVKAKEA